MAQLGARFHGMEEVIGSIPIRSTNYFKHLAYPSQIACPHFARKLQKLPSGGFPILPKSPSEALTGFFADGAWMFAPAVRLASETAACD